MKTETYHLPLGVEIDLVFTHNDPDGPPNPQRVGTERPWIRLRIPEALDSPCGWWAPIDHRSVTKVKATLEKCEREWRLPPTKWCAQYYEHRVRVLEGQLALAAKEQKQ